MVQTHRSLFSYLLRGPGIAKCFEFGERLANVCSLPWGAFFAAAGAFSLRELPWFILPWLASRPLGYSWPHLHRHWLLL